MITRVEGIRVGHWTDAVGRTGCTVVLCPPGTTGSGEVRGGAPGTRETDLLRPGMLVEEVDAVLLTGGSAFGLAAADGVMRFLEERGVGFQTRAGPVPIVPAAVLFDLGVGDPKVRPGPEEGYRACLAAGVSVEEGLVGAATGATVASLHGPHRAVRGGLGTTSVSDGALVVGALAAVNALGEIVDESGQLLAGALPESEEGSNHEGGDELGPTNTTLVVVATNARMSRERAHLLARAAHDGISEAVRPSHTRWDGDTVFTLATGTVEADQRTIETLTVAAVADAIRRGVRPDATAPSEPRHP